MNRKPSPEIHAARKKASTTSISFLFSLEFYLTVCTLQKSKGEEITKNCSKNNPPPPKKKKGKMKRP